MELNEPKKLYDEERLNVNLDMSAKDSMLNEHAVAKQIKGVVTLAIEEESAPPLPPASAAGAAQTLLTQLKSVKGYVFGLMFAVCSCLANVLIKMSPSLNGSNHAAMRYLVCSAVFLIMLLRIMHTFTYLLHKLLM